MKKQGVLKEQPKSTVKLPVSNSLPHQFLTLHTLMQTYQKQFRCQHIAGIWLKGALIAVGVNQRKTHTLQLKYGKNKWTLYLHAEVDAIKNFLQTHRVASLRTARMYVYRSGFRSSKPCLGCQRAIANFGIRKVYWT